MRACSPNGIEAVRHALNRYGFAVTAVALCAVLRWMLNPVLEGQGLYLAFMIPIAASAYLGGYGPGIVSIVLSAILADPRVAHLPDEYRAHLAHLSLFYFESVGVVVLIRRLQFASESARAALIRAEEANAAKEEFVARISHEWRSPLNVLTGWLGQIEQRSTDPELVRRAAAAMRRAVDIQMRLVSDVLDYSRGVRGKLSVALRRVAVSEPLHRAIEAVHAEVQQKQLALCVADSEEGIPVDADAVRLQQVFGNLLANAIKFTPPGGRIDIVVARSGPEVQVRISDTGIGIPPDALESIFKPFSQSDAGRDSRRGGLGLGLAIVREIVELHRGTVTAASAGPGRGSTFTVRLPIAATDTATEAVVA